MSVVDYEARIRSLISQMSLEEKVSQLSYSSPAIPRLGIPAYNWWNECLHGVARAGFATVFPQAISMAATFDEDLVRQNESALIPVELNRKVPPKREAFSSLSPSAFSSASNDRNLVRNFVFGLIF